MSKPGEHQHPLWQVLDKIQMDHRAMGGKITEMRMLLGQLALPDPSQSVCPTCGIKFRNRLVMEEHRYNSHGGEVPTHYLRAEELAG